MKAVTKKTKKTLRAGPRRNFKSLSLTLAVPGFFKLELVFERPADEKKRDRH